MAKRIRETKSKAYILLIKHIIWDCLKLEACYIFAVFIIIGLANVISELFVSSTSASASIQLLLLSRLALLIFIPSNILFVIEIIEHNVRDFSN